MAGQKDAMSFLGDRWLSCLLQSLEQEGYGLSHPRQWSPGHCPSCAWTSWPHDPSPGDGIGILVTFWKPPPSSGFEET